MYLSSFLIKKSVLSVRVAIAITTGVMTGCRQENLEINPENSETSELSSKPLKPNKFQFLSEEFDIPNTKYIWEAQLDMAIEHNYLLKDSKLELIRYQYIRHVEHMDDLKNIKSRLLDKNALLPVQNYKDTTNIFIIQRVEDKEWYKLVLNSILPISQKDMSKANDDAYIFQNKQNDLRVLQLEWKSDGKILHTVCLVSDTKGVITIIF